MTLSPRVWRLLQTSHVSSPIANLRHDGCRAYSSFYIAQSGQQAFPLNGYYSYLQQSEPQSGSNTTWPKASQQSSSEPSQSSRPLSPIPDNLLPKHSPSSPSSDPTPSSNSVSPAHIIFGSRLAGPTSARSNLLQPPTYIAGILVPPQPTEPDNCCMSGCVHCVWDVYREDMEEWVAKSTEAIMRLLAEEKVEKKEIRVGVADGDGGTGMDDDGGGSERAWSSEGVFGNVPVGIREFMRTEKRLKEKHREST